ncbi:MAG: cob(I)yrinic acid a,c-diamide adenosyltransferase [Betaproteobacteria bacterium]|jgi:cob(I)alamin adenosyltransferase
MGQRLTQITTRTGDAGMTGLGNNERVPKSHVRVQAMGDVDELNSMLGLLLCEEMALKEQALLVDIQHELFNLGGELSIPGFLLLKESAVADLDLEIASYVKVLPPLKEFILPGGTRSSTLAHVCRTVARRAERSLVTLSNEETYEGLGIQYLNRLSDVMFMLARKLNLDAGVPDVYWKSERLAKLNQPSSV